MQITGRLLSPPGLQLGGQKTLVSDFASTQIQLIHVCFQETQSRVMEFGWYATEETTENIFLGSAVL